MTTAPPGWLPDTGADSQALIKEARRRQRRRYLVTGLVALGLLTGAAEVAVSQLGPGHRSPVHSGSSVPIAAAPVDYSAAPAHYAYLDQGSLYSYTSHGTQYGASVSGRYLKVRATATGRLLATVSPPRPYNDFQLLTADADGRTFVLGAMRYWQHNAGPSPRLAQRNQRTPLAFLLVQITPGGHVRLSQLSLPEALTLRQAPSIALSPDGTRLAVAFGASGSTAMLQVIALDTGHVRQWTASHVSWRPLLNGAGAWTADGRTLAFQQRAVPPVQTLRAYPTPGNMPLRLLDTAAPGTSLTTGQLLVLRPPPGESAPAGPILTPDGRAVIGSVISLSSRRPTGRWTGGLAVYSARTGALLRITAPWGWSWRWPSPPGRGGSPRQTLAWSTRSGTRLIVLQPRGDLNVLGVATADAFAPADGRLLAQQPAGYQELQYALRTSSQLAW
jgi:hypothetical protein